LPTLETRLPMPIFPLDIGAPDHLGSLTQRRRIKLLAIFPFAARSL